MISSIIMRLFIFITLFIMVILAVFFLKGRELSGHEYILWGLLALFLPVLGPYLVILARPGQPIQL